METLKSYECPKCHAQTSDINGSGVCDLCESKGYWIDPAGGVHFDNNEEHYDPASKYE